MPLLVTPAEAPVEHAAEVRDVLKWTAWMVLETLVPHSCTSTVDMNRLIGGRVVERVQLYWLRNNGTPPSLADVYGDEEVPLDAYGRDFWYRSPGTDGAWFDLVSAGLDGTFGTDDDIDVAASFEWRVAPAVRVEGPPL